MQNVTDVDDKIILRARRNHLLANYVAANAGDAAKVRQGSSSSRGAPAAAGEQQRQQGSSGSHAACVWRRAGAAWEPGTARGRAGRCPVAVTCFGWLGGWTGSDLSGSCLRAIMSSERQRQRGQVCVEAA